MDLDLRDGAALEAREQDAWHFSRGRGAVRIVTTLCPGGKERMRRLMEVVRHGRVDLTPLLTHTFPLDDIKEAYEVFGARAGGVIKVAIKP